MRTKIILGLMVLCSGLIFSACTGEHEKHAEAGKYTCPMHPQVIKGWPRYLPDL
jgi:hypothetical protein